MTIQASATAGEKRRTNVNETQLTTATTANLAQGRPGQNPALVYLAGLSETGRRSMKQRLETVTKLAGVQNKLDSFDWSSLRYEHVVAIRSRLSESGLSPASVNATLCAIRGVAREAWNLGLMSTDDYTRINGVKGLRSSRLPAGRMLSPGEIGALFHACRADKTAAGRREGAKNWGGLGGGVGRCGGAG